MNLPQIRQDIVSNLREYLATVFSDTDFKVIDDDSINRRPEYPYASYKIITPFDSEFENEILTTDNTVETFKEDGIMTMSFWSHSLSLDETWTLIHQMFQYFQHQGRELLYTKGITVLEVDDISDATQLLSVDRERRQTFDVLFRIENTSTRDIEIIETVELEVRREND